jgi:hypothetical protein
MQLHLSLSWKFLNEDSIVISHQEEVESKYSKTWLIQSSREQNYFLNYEELLIQSI